jgi:hypothetical protein
VELVEQIRRQFEFGAGTVAGVSRKLDASTGEWCGKCCAVLSRRQPAEGSPPTGHRIAHDIALFAVG